LPDTNDWGNPAASPLLAPSLAGHPRTLLITADFDVLRDEGEAYADRLIQAGVEVELHRLRGSIHGFASTNVFTNGLVRTLGLMRRFMTN
jgi:acetyl esterase/lipase